MSQDKSNVAYVSREMAKLYKALGSHVVASLRAGSRVDALAGQFEPESICINAAGLRWLRAAEALVASSDRDSINLDDLALAFEATYEPSENGWCERGVVWFWQSPAYAPDKSFRNDYQGGIGDAEYRRICNHRWRC